MKKLLIACLFSLLFGQYSVAHGAVADFHGEFKEDLKKGITLKDGSISQLLEDKWIFNRKSSALGDNTIISLSLDATTPESSMRIRCSEKKTEIFFVLNEYMGSSALTFEYKIDTAPIIKTTVEPSEAGNAIFMPAAVKFIKSLLGKNTLAIRVAPYNQAKTERVFDISGIENVIEPLAQECGWSVKAK